MRDLDRLRQSAAVRAVLDSQVRHRAQNVLLERRAVQRLAMRWHDTGIAGDPADAAAVTVALVELTARAGADIKAARVVELGPGQTPHVLVAAVMLGAEAAVGLDTHAYLDSAVYDRRTYEPLAHELRSCGYDVVVPEGLDHRLRVATYDGFNMPIGDASVDIVWSHSVLEHVRRPDVVLAEVRRVLRSGGVLASIIDLRDHLRLGDGQNWLRMLRYSDSMFDRMFSNRSSWVNRLRAEDWRTLIAACGLEVVIDDRVRESLPQEFDRQDLDDRFAGWSDEDLAVSFSRVAARVP